VFSIISVLLRRYRMKGINATRRLIMLLSRTPRLLCVEETELLTQILRSVAYPTEQSIGSRVASHQEPGTGGQRRPSHTRQFYTQHACLRISLYIN